MIETGIHSISPFASISYSQMRFSKKQIAGITAVALVVYSLRRWRSNSTNIDDSEFGPDQTSPTTE